MTRRSEALARVHSTLPQLNSFWLEHELLDLHARLLVSFRALGRVVDRLSKQGTRVVAFHFAAEFERCARLLLLEDGAVPRTATRICHFK